jgi:hypothetical protein
MNKSYLNDENVRLSFYVCDLLVRHVDDTYGNARVVYTI